MTNNFEQSDKIDQWFVARWSKFTASSNYRLLSSGVGTMFGTGAISYIKEKVLEMTVGMWERPELEEVKSLLHGTMYEIPHFKALVAATGYNKMAYLGSDNPLFLEYEPLKGESGGSPDCLLLNSDAKVDIVAEMKSPKNPMYHFERLKWKDQWDVKENYILAYTQIQNLLMITEAPLALFSSFDERQKNPTKRIKIIEIRPDKKFQDNLELRIRMAIKEKYRMFDEYMNA